MKNAKLEKTNSSVMIWLEPDKPYVDELSDPLISDTAGMALKWVFFTIMCQAVDLFGIGTNVVNIICFVRQGFKDPVNVSLVGLAVADLGCLITLIWTNICITPAFSEADLPFEPAEIQFLVSGMPHVTFTRVSAWITALITLERCLCITMPLKVKSLLTPKRVSAIIVCIFTILLSSVAPLYVVNRLGMKFFPAKNKTLLGLVPTTDRELVDTISFAINNGLVPFGAFLVVIICTAILVINLRSNTKWREKLSSAAQGDNVSARNQKVAKMVVVISTIFISSFIPSSLMFMAMASEPKFSVDGEYKNLLLAIGGLCLLLETTNSSVNIFIYYHMSSKYRDTFHLLLCPNRVQ